MSQKNIKLRFTKKEQGKDSLGWGRLDMNIPPFFLRVGNHDIPSLKLTFSHLKMDGLVTNTRFLLGEKRPIFRCKLALLFFVSGPV